MSTRLQYRVFFQWRTAGYHVYVEMERRDSLPWPYVGLVNQHEMTAQKALAYAQCYVWHRAHKGRGWWQYEGTDAVDWIIDTNGLKP